MNDDIHGLAGAYAVDAVDDAERARFEQHLAGCAECRHEVDSLRSAATHLADITEVAPPPSLRTAVLRDIVSVRPLPPEVSDLDARRAERRGGGRHFGGLTTWLAGAAAAVLIAVGALVWQPWDRPAQPPVLTATQQVLQARDAARYAQSLDGAKATIVRSPSLRRAVIITDNMPAAPAGHVYEVWLQHKDGSMAKAALMPEGSQKQVSIVLNGDAASAVGAGITVEPEGGSLTPTTKPLLLFSFA